jgi:hypothetical protein
MKRATGLGFWSRRRPAKAPVDSAVMPQPEPLEQSDAATVEPHFCCICGAVLAGDLEDEINGEGWGRDICGNCNRTKNDDAITMGW